MSERLRNRIAHRAALDLLGRLGHGQLTLVEDGHERTFGEPAANVRARVEVHDRRAWTLLRRGSAGLAEGYVNRLWDTDDLVAVVRLIARNMAGFDRIRRRLHPVVGPARRLARKVPRNTPDRARAHIAAHYDLGNDLFSTFLDQQLVYSCAYFPRSGATLEEAQEAKLERICAQLELGPDDHLLEIGTGWGGLAAHAAAQRGCRVTTTTISREQREYAMARVRELGLEDRVTVLGSDYRDLAGEFDALVSVEMIEAVGWQYFPVFFRKCSELLREGGRMLLQAIVIDDEGYEVEKASPSFANTLVFPGGCLPSERVIRETVARETDMAPVWSDDITAHYAETLRHWRERFDGASVRLEGMGYDDRFRRLWRFYLAFSEAGFRERRIRDLQMVFAKSGARAGTSTPADVRELAIR
jgi:cyclopropane-fatty-acyl-phospholipid synthase